MNIDTDKDADKDEPYDGEGLEVVGDDKDDSDDGDVDDSSFGLPL